MKTKIDSEWLSKVARGTAGFGEAPPAGRPTGRTLSEGPSAGRTLGELQLVPATPRRDSTYTIPPRHAHGEREPVFVGLNTSLVATFVAVVNLTQPPDSVRTRSETPVVRSE
jgi:hypothetical protein